MNRRATLSRLGRDRRQLTDVIAVTGQRYADASARIDVAIAALAALDGQDYAPDCAPPAGVQDSGPPGQAVDQVLHPIATNMGKDWKVDHQKFRLAFPRAHILVSGVPHPVLCTPRDPDCAPCTVPTLRSGGQAAADTRQPTRITEQSDRSARAAPSDMDRDQLLTIIEAAEAAGVSTDTIHRRLRQGRFPGARRVPRPGSRAEPPWMIPAGDLIADGYSLDPIGRESDPIVKKEKEIVELRVALARAEGQAELAERIATTLEHLVEMLSHVSPPNIDMPGDSHATQR